MMVDLTQPQKDGDQKNVEEKQRSSSIMSAHRCHINIRNAFRCWDAVKCWSSLRAWMTFFIPACCTCGAVSSSDQARVQEDVDAESVPGTTVTATIFGCRKGKVTLCIQEDPKGSPLMLLELSMPTHVLVKEMSSGLLRIALECERDKEDKDRSLYAEPVWSMFCNGRKVGFALKRQLSDNNKAVLKLMESVSIGAGVIPSTEGRPKTSEDDEIMYMRAAYERVVGSSDSESFHMINPDGSQDQQELSIFLLRS